MTGDETRTAVTTEQATLDAPPDPAERVGPAVGQDGEPDDDRARTDAAEPADEREPGAWLTPTAWAATLALFLVASDGPVTWLRVEVADVTGALIDDIWLQALLVLFAGLVVAGSKAAVDLLRRDRGAIVAAGLVVAVLLVSTAWSEDSTRTFEQALLLAFATAAALFGGAALERTMVVTALFVALHVGIAVSVFADLRSWPGALDRSGTREVLGGVFGSTDRMGMIALLAATTTIVVMVLVLRLSPEERLAAAEARADKKKGPGGFKLPTMGTINTAIRYARSAGRGSPPGGGLGGTRLSTSTPGQAMQMKTSLRGRRRRLGGLGGVRESFVRRILTAVLLLGVVVLDGFVWWRSQSYGALFAIVATAIVVLVVGLGLPGASEGPRRTAAGLITVVAAAGVVALIVFRSEVAEFFDRDGTWSGRTTIWDAAIDVVADQPIHGYGFAAGEAAGVDVRSGFVQVLLGAGLIGLVALAWLMIETLRRVTSAASMVPDTLAVWVVAMATYGIAANVNESFVSAFSLPWLMLVFALGHAVARREGRLDDVTMT